MRARSVFFFTDAQAIGGAEQSLLTLITALDRDLWRPTLLVSDSPVRADLTARAQALGVPAVVVPALPLGADGLRRLPAFAAMLSRHRPDVFHANLSSPLAAKFALTAALIAHIEATVATVQLIPPFPLSRSSRLQLKLLAARIGRILAVSEAIRRQLIGELGWPGERIEVVYNSARPMPAPLANRPVLTEELKLNPDWPVVLVTARLDEQKGHDVLLQAAARLPETTFLLAGEGPKRASLEAQAAGLQLNDRIRFLGRREDVSTLLEACDVFVLPSLYEGSSLSLLEAMSAGRPVVTSDIPGTDELVSDGQTGLLTPPGDVEALTVALRRVLYDADLRRRLGEAAQAEVRARFNPEAMARAVTRVYSQLLDVEQGARRDE